jgi:hypothetical protein
MLLLFYYYKETNNKRVGSGEWGVGSGEWGVVKTQPQKTNKLILFSILFP